MVITLSRLVSALVHVDQDVLLIAAIVLWRLFVRLYTVWGGSP